MIIGLDLIEKLRVVERRRKGWSGGELGKEKRLNSELSVELHVTIAIYIQGKLCNTPYANYHICGNVVG